MDQLFSYKSLVHAISGAAGGTSAITVFYPLNSVRTRMMVSDSEKKPSTLEMLLKIIKKEGVLALYQGWWSSVVGLGASNFVYFYIYNGLKIAYQHRRRARGLDTTIGPWLNLLIASLAGVINVLTTTPLWVVGTRLMVQAKKQPASGSSSGNKDGHVSYSTPYTGIYDGLTRIAKEEGVGALWNGTGPSLVLVSNPTIHFIVYEQLKELLVVRVKQRGYEITPVEFFIMGAIAKMVATIVTFPLQIAQSRLRVSKVDSNKKEGDKKSSSTPTYSGTIDVLNQLYKKDGFAGWFRGMEAKLWQTVLTAAFQFVTYEQIQMLIFKLLLGDKYLDSGARAIKH